MIELPTPETDAEVIISDEINDMAVFASVHGWKSFRIEQGKLLQDKIKQIGEALKGEK